jgi:hypothetical protein
MTNKTAKQTNPKYHPQKQRLERGKEVSAKMGNTNCVADGGTPHKMTITLSNATPYIFVLDKSARCCSKCNEHCGFSAESGKFVNGHVPPIEIKPNASSDIHVSGRESSAVVPDGWIQYEIHDPLGNATLCKIRVNYSGAGWSSFQNKTVVECIFVGSPPADL